MTVYHGASLFLACKKYLRSAVMQRSLIAIAFAVLSQNCLAASCMEKWLPLFVKEKYSPEDIDKLLAVACKIPASLPKSAVTTAATVAAATTTATVAADKSVPAQVASVSDQAAGAAVKSSKSAQAPQAASEGEPAPGSGADAGNGKPAAPAEKVVFVTPPNDAGNYQSDKIKFSYARSAYRVDMASKGREVTEVCIPGSVRLKGIGKVYAKIDTAKDVQAENAFMVEDDGSLVTGSTHCKNKASIVAHGDIVVFSSADFESAPPERYGFTYGALMVPYKYYLTGSKSFSGGTSVGGYLGYRLEKTGWDLQLVGFAGAGQVPVTQSVNGQDKTQNLSGFSYGVGLLGTVKDSFHMGVIIGADRVNPDAGFKDNGKPWIAVELGYAFSK